MMNVHHKAENWIRQHIPGRVEVAAPSGCSLLLMELLMELLTELLTELLMELLMKLLTELMELMELMELLTGSCWCCLWVCCSPPAACF